jgi:hypothetical protein
MVFAVDSGVSARSTALLGYLGEQGGVCVCVCVCACVCVCVCACVCCRHRVPPAEAHA